MTRLGIVALAQPKNGGVFQYTQSVLTAAKALKNWNITVYTSASNHAYDEFGFPVHRLKNLSLCTASSLALDWLDLKSRKLFLQEDVVLAPTYSALLLSSQRPFVYTLHDLQERHLPENFSVLQKAWRGYIHWRLARRAKAIICESSFVKKDIVHFLGVEPSKISVIEAPPLPVSFMSLAEKPSQQVRTKYNLPETYVFYPAQFWPHKNHLRLVEAFRRIVPIFSDCHLVFTGSARDEHRRVFEYVRKVALTDKVIHLGYVDPSDMRQIYLNAAAVVVPTLFESISIPIYEAFQLGVPVCASCVVGLPDQVRDAALLFDPLSVDSIASALSRILSDKTLRLDLIANGHKRLAELTLERFADAIDAVLREIR